MPKSTCRIEAGLGDLCPRCDEIMVKYEHSPGWKPEPGRYYYKYWFICINTQCRTTVICPHQAQAGGPDKMD
jgi:hypothetical protein